MDSPAMQLASFIVEIISVIVSIGTFLVSLIGFSQYKKSKKLLSFYTLSSVISFWNETYEKLLDIQKMKTLSAKGFDINKKCSEALADILVKEENVKKQLDAEGLDQFCSDISSTLPYISELSSITNNQELGIFVSNRVAKMLINIDIVRSQYQHKKENQERMLSK